MWDDIVASSKSKDRLLAESSPKVWEKFQEGRCWCCRRTVVALAWGLGRVVCDRCVRLSSRVRRAIAGSAAE